MKHLLAVIGLSMVSLNTFADNCEQPRNTFDDAYCMNKVYADVDNELNKNYKLLRSLLNSSQKSILKESQLAWINSRDHFCVNENRVSVECQLEFTQSRNNWLSDRIRECKTIGCQTNRLREVNSNMIRVIFEKH